MSNDGFGLSQQNVNELPIDSLALRLLAAMKLEGSLSNRQHYDDTSFISNLIRCGPLDRAAGRKLLESFDWLVFHGLVAFKGNGYGSWTYITERGERASRNPRALQSINALKRIDVDLHPSIAERVRSQFALGEYESAVVLAFRTIEIRVREASGAPNSLYGVPLMRHAFNPKFGPLSDPHLESGEKHAIADLFSGAIGAFKNPASHREVEYDEPVLASEAVIFADLLLRLLDNMSKPESVEVDGSWEPVAADT